MTMNSKKPETIALDSQITRKDFGNVLEDL